MIEGFLRLMNSPDGVTGPINLGNPVEMSIVQLAETICSIIGTSVELNYHPLPEDDPKQRQPDITKARNTLDWEPHVALEDGLKKTITYFDNLLKSTSSN